MTRILANTAAAALLFGFTCAHAETSGKRILVLGHRGAKASRPENTLPAFEFAIAQGADAIEFDVAVTKDNALVVSHDPVLHPPVCSGSQPSAVIHSLTLEEVKKWDCGSIRNPEAPNQQTVPGTRIPTLDEVFRLASKGDFLFNLETKSFPKRYTRAEAERMLPQFGVTADSPAGEEAIRMITSVGPEVTPPPDEFARMVREKIREYGLEQRMIVQSFDFRVLHAMKKIAPEIRLSALSSETGRSFAEIGREAGAQIVSPMFRGVTKEKVQEAHAAGFQVIPWTVDRPEDWKRMVEAGVDGIITDDPQGLIAFLKQ